MAERCCLKKKWGSNGRNVSVDSSKASKNRGSFPNDESALKLLYLALRNISTKWTIPIGTMEASFESVCDSVSRKAEPYFWNI